MLPRKEFFVSKNAKLIFVSDYFYPEIIGGAELTHDAILQKCPVPYDKIHCRSVTIEMVEANKDKYWLLGNISQITKDALVTIARETKFSRIECDYSYCLYRSSHLHKLQTGEDCNCHLTDPGRFMQGLFKRAERVHFMSEGQKQEYLRLFPKMKEWPDGKLRVQGSTFSEEKLDYLESLYKNPAMPTDSWAVLKGGSWIKNQGFTEAYCRSNKIHYGLVGGMPPDEFLKALHTFHGLVFHPKGFDTNPRITIEAKLLGLELDLNENVQQKDEPWFAGSREETMKHQRGLAEKFWTEGLVITDGAK